jgi:hypothetical protein
LLSLFNLPNNLLVKVTPEYQCIHFDKTLPVGEIIRLTKEDKFKYHMVEYILALQHMGSIFVSRLSK